MTVQPKRSTFSAIARRASEALGSHWAFAGAAVSVVLWAMTGPMFNFSDTWQLVINTGTTIITFLMVFLIQNTQNRDTRAMPLKLDEIIRSVAAARDSMIDIEDRTDDEISAIASEFEAIGSEPSRPRK